MISINLPSLQALLYNTTLNSPCRFKISTKTTRRRSHHTKSTTREHGCANGGGCPRARRIDLAVKEIGSESVAEYFARPAEPSTASQPIAAENAPAKPLVLTFDVSVQSFLNTE